MAPEQELTFGQKAKIGFQAAGAFARNPKALVALVKYQRAERTRQKQAKAQPQATSPDTVAPQSTAPQATAPEE